MGVKKKKIITKWGSWGKWPSNLSMQPTDPFAVFTFLASEQKHSGEKANRITFPGIWKYQCVTLSSRTSCMPWEGQPVSVLWMSPDTTEQGPSLRRCLVNRSSELRRWTVRLVCFEVREEKDPGRCSPSGLLGLARRLKSPCGGLSPDSSRAHPTDIFRPTLLPSLGLPNLTSPCPLNPQNFLAN